MEAPVAMRESMTTTMPSPPDWRSVVFIFNAFWEEKKKEYEKVSAILRVRRRRKQKRARETSCVRTRFPLETRKKKNRAGAPSIGNFSLPISSDPTGPHLGRERGEKKRRRDRLKEQNHAPERRCSRTCARREALFFFNINANKRVCVLC